MLGTALIFIATLQQPDLASFLDSLESKHYRGTVYVEKEGRPLFFHTVGMADPDSKRPFTPATGYCIGSIVKPIVRVALANLEDAGKLSMQDKISKYFPEAPADKADITLEMVAAHRAGFQDVFGGDYEPIKRDDLVRKLLESKLINKPGTEESYSNSGFSLLATVIEKVTKKSLEGHVYETQFKKLGLSRLGYVRPGWKTDELAVGYGPQGKRWGSPLDHFWFHDGPSWHLRGNGGMISTASDLAAWMTAVHEAKIVSKKQVEKAWPMIYGPGGNLDRFQLSAGGNGIFTTIGGYNPKLKMAVVATSCDGRFSIEEVTKDLFKHIRELGK